MQNERPQHGTPHRDEITRLRRIEGQVRGLQRMIEEDRYCIDILTQIRSVSRALGRVGDSILRRHLEHCVVEALESGNAKQRASRINEVLAVLERGR